MKPMLQGVVLFSDDIREELGGKTSYMGVLGPEIVIPIRRPLVVVCTFLLWAVENEVTISANFELENAPEGIRVADPFERTVRKDEGDDATTWMIQMHGRTRLRVEERPVTFQANFSVGDQVFTNRLVMEGVSAAEYEAMKV